MSQTKLFPNNSQVKYNWDNNIVNEALKFQGVHLTLENVQFMKQLNNKRMNSRLFCIDLDLK